MTDQFTGLSGTPDRPVEAPPRPLLQHYGAAFIYEGDTMVPNWAAPFGWILFCIACGTVLAIMLAGCQAPLR